MKTNETLKICAAVCEYNPFHNGHAYHLSQMKQSGADLTVVMMSGNFTQRGAPAMLDKYTRARHACLQGADIVIELPTVFATANAEVFAQGALKLIASLPGQKTLCFGAETPDKDVFLSAAKALNSESKSFKESLKEELATGAPYAKARAAALQKTTDIPEEILSSPNNILGLEYTRATVKNNYTIDLLPIPRQGAMHGDVDVRGDTASSTAIRALFTSGQVKKTKKCVPQHVYADLKDAKNLDFDSLYLYSILMTDAETLAKTADCTEGLENRIKALAVESDTFATFLQKTATKRYTDARIRRICTANLLSIRDEFVKKCLKSDLYLKVLAYRENSGALAVLSQAQYPLMMRMSDQIKLQGVAKSCFEKDLQCANLYTMVSESDMPIFIPKRYKRQTKRPLKTGAFFVWRDRSVSRVLSYAAIYLDGALPPRSSDVR